MTQFGGPKLVKSVSLGNKGKKSLIKGVQILADAVGSTLGAGGRTVVIEDDFGNPYVTKDGVTVANSILLADPKENLGVSMVKQAAQNTASKAGDGTTTSTVLTQAIIKAYYDLKGDEFSFRDIRKGVEGLRDFALSGIEKRSIPVNDDLLEQVSTISSNNDKELGSLIAKAFRKAGDSGIVTFEKSPTNETYVDVVEGTKINSTTKIHHFHTNQEKETCELDNPLVFISTTDIPNVRKIQDILEYAIKSNRSILLVAPLESQPLTALAMNKVKGNIKVNVIDPPSFGLKRKDILEDLALLVGATVFDGSLGDSLDAISPDMLGECQKAFSDSDGTVIVVDDKKDEVEEKIETLKVALEDTDHHVLTKHLEARLALLTGGVSVLYVGADTEVELKEKEDRVDDAIHAVKAAKKEGILPGGGAALHYFAANNEAFVNTSELAGFNILKKALFEPFNKILTNAGLNPMSKEYNIKKWGQGVDVIDGKVKDMIEAGIIDPAMVTKEALKNAVSVALTILSTDAVVCNVREE